MVVAGVRANASRGARAARRACSSRPSSKGVDVYLSGEVSEQNVHLARESGVIYIAAGHHATERYGVRALAEHLAERFDLQCEFVDIDSPV